MPIGRIPRSFTYTIQQSIQETPIVVPIEYKVICKYNDNAYNSIGSYPDLTTALGMMSNKILERDSNIKAIFIDKVNMDTLENTEYISVTISG